MTKLRIANRASVELNMFDAVQEATTPYDTAGTLESMKERMHMQERLIAGLLMVVFNDYGDEYHIGHEPKNRAEQLAFVLGTTGSTIRVDEV